jgi:hypothetical protein
MEYEKFLKTLSHENLKLLVQKHNEKLNIKVTKKTKKDLIDFLLQFTEYKENKINLKQDIPIKDITFQKNLYDDRKDNIIKEDRKQIKRETKQEKLKARESGKLGAQIENLKDELGNEEYEDFDEQYRGMGLQMTKKKTVSDKALKLKDEIKKLQDKKKSILKELRDIEKTNELLQKERKTKIRNY